MHIGLIGGIGPAATEFYYRGLVKAHADEGKKMELTIVQADMQELVKNAGAGAKEEQAEVFCDLVWRLKKAGADFAAVTSLGGHFCIKELEAISPLPILNALRVIEHELDIAGFPKTILLGTRFVMESRLYGSASWERFVVPTGKDLDGVHEAYIGMAQAGYATEEQKEYLLSVVRNLSCDREVEGVLLGGTDLFLAFGDQRTLKFDDVFQCLSLVDSARAHVDAIWDYSADPEFDLDYDFRCSWFGKPPDQN